MCRWAYPQEIMIQFFLNTDWKKNKILAFVFNEKSLALIILVKNPSVNSLCVSFITNIQLWFTT